MDTEFGIGLEYRSGSNEAGKGRGCRRSTATYVREFTQEPDGVRHGSRRWDSAGMMRQQQMGSVKT